MKPKIAVCDRMTQKKYKNCYEDGLWEYVKKRSQNVIRTSETTEEYSRLGRDKKHEIKDIGGWVGGELKEGLRKNGHVLCRTIGTLDADIIPEGVDFIALLRSAFPSTEWFANTTHSHTPESPRFRLAFLFSREVSEDEYAPLMRKVAEKLGMDYFDDTTYQANRMMFWSSCSKNGEFLFEENHGEPLDVDTTLGEYADWRDCSTWPTSSRQSEIVKRTVKKLADPLQKDGIVGAFCRTYGDIHTTIAELIPDYEPTVQENRYNYIPGQSHGGVVIYDDQISYSHHDTDPAGGKACNSWDLVMHHKFSDLEGDKQFKAMCEFAQSDPKVKLQIIKEQSDTADADFAEDYKDGDDDPYPFIEVTAKGSIKVNPPKLAEYFKEHNHWFLTKGNSGKVTFWIYTDGIYRKASENEVKGIIQNYIKAYKLDLVASRTVNEVYSILANTLRYKEVDELDNDEDKICFANGLYSLKTGELMPHTPNHLGTIKLPVNWNPSVGTDAPRFNKYLGELTDGDAEKQKVLKQFMGMVISNVRGYRAKKALFLVGKGNTGKSQLRALLERLVGKNNCASVDLKALEAKFGTGAIHGKRLVGTNDLSYTDVPELQIFKQLTGGDSIQFESKYADAFNDVFKGVLWFTMNNLPSFGGDRGKHVLKRICIVECGEPCPDEKQNPMLVNEFWGEREQIVNDLVNEIREVVANRYRYAEPQSAKKALEQYEKDLSTAKTFVSEFFEYNPEVKYCEQTRTTTIYNLYVVWARNQQYPPVSPQRFNREVSEYLGLKPDEFKLHSKQGNYYPLWFNNNGAQELAHVSDRPDPFQ